MRKAWAIVLALGSLVLPVLPVPSYAQQTQSAIQSVINSDIISCGNGCITGAELNALLTSMNSATFQFTQFPNTFLAPQNFPSGAIVPTQGLGDASSAAASTLFVSNALNAAVYNLPHSWGALQTFSGGAVVPTRSLGDNTTNAASTAFVATALGSSGILATANTWSALQTFSGGVSIGSPLVPVTSLQNPNFGSNSLTSLLVNGAAVSATTPETGIQSIINSAFGSANVDTAFKIAVFGFCGASTGSADCYGANFVTTLQSGLASNVTGIALEADANCNNANYGDTAGIPTLPFCVPFYIALGPSSMRSTAMMMANVSGPTNRGLVFFTLNAQQVRYNVIEDYSTVSIGGLIKAAGHYPGPAAIDLSAATGAQGALLAPNNVPLGWVNAAQSAFIYPITLDGSNIFNLGTGAAGVIINPAASGTIKLQINGAGVGDYGSTVGSSWFFSPNMFLNGIISMQANSASTSTTTGTLRITGGAGVTGAVTVGALLQIGTVYSAAGTPLPSCAAGTNGASAVVSDATSATYAGAYTSGGAQQRRVLCVSGTGWTTQ